MQFNTINCHCEPTPPSLRAAPPSLRAAPPSLRAEGEAIHLSSCTAWNMDCHVATLLAMTRVSGHCEPTPPVIASHPPSLRAEGEAIHLKSCTSWNIDCHVASLLAMTRVSGHCEPKAKQSILSPAPPEIWIATSLCSSQWHKLESLRAEGEAIHLESCTVWNMDCHVASLLAMTGIGVIASRPLSLRAEGEAIHLSSCTTWKIDCHVALLLAMTGLVWFVTSLHSSQWQYFNFNIMLSQLERILQI